MTSISLENENEIDYQYTGYIVRAKNTFIDITPKRSMLFKKSLAFSKLYLTICISPVVVKGNSNLLMASKSKRRRTKEEIKQDKLEQELKLQAIERHDAVQQQMQQQLEQQRQELERLWEENRQMNGIKTEVIPRLVKEGLLKTNA